MRPKVGGAGVISGSFVMQRGVFTYEVNYHNPKPGIILYTYKRQYDEDLAKERFAVVAAALLGNKVALIDVLFPGLRPDLGFQNPGSLPCPIG